MRILDEAIGYFKENPDFPAQASAFHFVSCFCEKKDDLSQWRAYGNGENGFAIGFKAVDLWGCPMSMLARVNYDNLLHRKLAKKTAEEMVNFAREGLNRFSPPDEGAWLGEFFQAWEAEITGAFSEESRVCE